MASSHVPIPSIARVAAVAAAVAALAMTMVAAASPAGATAPGIAVGTTHSPSIPGQPVTYTASISGMLPYSGTIAFSENGVPLAGCGALAITPDSINPAFGDARCTVNYSSPGTHTISARYSGDGVNDPSETASVTQSVVPPPTATITSQSGVFTRGEVLHGTVSDAGGPGLQGVVVYYHGYTQGGGSGAILAACDNCRPGQASATWTYTIPSNAVPGVYAIVAQPVDTAFNFGTPSNVIYQIVQ